MLLSTFIHYQPKHCRCVTSLFYKFVSWYSVMTSNCTHLVCHLLVYVSIAANHVVYASSGFLTPHDMSSVMWTCVSYTMLIISEQLLATLSSA